MTARQRWLWLLLTVGAASAFASLGAWQLGRAELKRERLDAFAQARQRAPRDLAAVLADGDAATLQRVRAVGELDSSGLFYLDNQIVGGRAGVRAFAPLRVRGVPSTVLVELGWVALTPNRVMPAPPALPERLDAIGWLAPPPAAGIRMGAALPSGGAPLVNYIDTAALRTLFGDGLVLDAVFHPDPAPASGYAREFQPAPGLPPERHRGYAVQWFGLALAVIVIFLVLGFRRR